MLVCYRFFYCLIFAVLFCGDGWVCGASSHVWGLDFVGFLVWAVFWFALGWAGGFCPRALCWLYVGWDGMRMGRYIAGKEQIAR